MGAYAMNRHALAEYVEALITRYGSLAALAKAVDVQSTTISGWAGRGTRKPSNPELNQLVSLAMAGGHNVGDLLMALYGIDPEQLIPTAPHASVATVLMASGSGKTETYRRLTARHQLMLLLPEQPATPDPPDEPPRSRGRS